VCQAGERVLEASTLMRISLVRGRRLEDSPVAQAPKHERFRLHSIFVGPDGLRAGWAVLLFLFFLICLSKLLAPVMRLSTPAHVSAATGMPASRMIAGEAAGLAAVLGATWLMSRLERRKISDYGLTDRQGSRHFVLGAVSGAVLLSVLVLSLNRAGALVFDGAQLFGWAAFAHSAIWLCAFLLVGFFEELLFRGYAQYTISRGVRGMCRRVSLRQANAIGFWTAAVLTSFCFGFGHGSNAGESPIGLVAAGLIALVFCLSIWRTGSLWWAIGFHMAWDWAESFLYGVGDSGTMIQHRLLASHPTGGALISGGATGPEGSVLALPVIAVAFCAVILTLPRTRSTGTSEPYADESSAATARVD